MTSKTMTVEDAERRAHEAAAIMRGRITNAVRYCEAYESTDRTVVVDGSHYTPSTRVLPGAQAVYQASYETHGLWEAFEAIVDRLEDISVPDGRTESDHPADWTVGWEGGRLYAYAPECDAGAHGDRP